MLGDPATAHAIATALRTEYPHAARLAAIWVRTTPDNVPVDGLIEVAAPFVAADEEVNLALAYRAVGAGRFEEAVPFARRATELDALSPHAWHVLGLAHHGLGYHPSRGLRRDTLREADTHYERAARLAREQKMPGLESFRY